MVKFNHSIQFILNDEDVSTEAPPGTLALDYARQHRHLNGTKSGCKEGDCGACTVIVGELDAQGKLRYLPMTSCLLPIGELHGKHLVTIEGLNMKELSPVQQAMVDCGGSQCGYCTPGFVVAMTAGLMEPKLPLNETGVLHAISGNLCRCTGYRPIKAAGVQAIEALADKLNTVDRVQSLVEAGALPEYFTGIADRLKTIHGETGVPQPEMALDASDGEKQPRFIISGGTDLYVQRGDELPNANVVLLNNGKRIGAPELRDGRVTFDARMTFEAFAEDPLILRHLPEMPAYNDLIASWPMRTRSSIGGNICNASPIADMTCLMLALEAELTLSGDDGRRRNVPLREFYLGYKRLNKKPEEIVASISFPSFSEPTVVNWEKVSKRAWLDIATVNAACKLRVEDGRFAEVHLALGGVAATPLYLSEASRALEGEPLAASSIHACIDVAMGEFTPMGDVRGSADYKRLLARQLLLVHFEKLYPETISQEDLYAPLR
ncbi:MAG: 2Fe-2S iron-sulfur cluster binding domain-containing protein [Verrucomicrobia bacterium]|jgi:xanthine dehydrogenase small subunit|nr:2Fe-2S iron-sulfur cluster binding domain-containing protein [Verrucomicrobiota bacterium]